MLDNLIQLCKSYVWYPHRHNILGTIEAKKWHINRIHLAPNVLIFIGLSSFRQASLYFSHHKVKPNVTLCYWFTNLSNSNRVTDTVISAINAGQHYTHQCVQKLGVICRHSLTFL